MIFVVGATLLSVTLWGGAHAIQCRRLAYADNDGTETEAEKEQIERLTAKAQEHIAQMNATCRDHETTIESAFDGSDVSVVYTNHEITMDYHHKWLVQVELFVADELKKHDLMEVILYKIKKGELYNETAQALRTSLLMCKGFGTVVKILEKAGNYDTENGFQRPPFASEKQIMRGVTQLSRC